MKKLLVIVIALVMGVTALGYARGWFSVSNGNKVDVQVDPAKLKHDKDAFTKSIGEKTGLLKSKIASLWKEAEGLGRNEKAQAKQELAELEKKSERLETQLKELAGTGEDKFESIKQDLSKALEHVEQKTRELTEKVTTWKGK